MRELTIGSVDAFYEILKGKAVKLQREYQSQLRNGIKVAVDLVNQVQQDKKDGDVDVKVRIAPNTYTEDVTITAENFGDLDNIIADLKQSYNDVLSIANVEGIPKYKDLLDELELIKTKQNPSDAQNHLEKVKKQIAIARKIQEYRNTYERVDPEGQGISQDRVVIYGEYDLLIRHKQGSLESKTLKGKYNSVSSNTTKSIENSYNQQSTEEIMMPTQNEFLRYFTINVDMVRKARAAMLDPENRFPNPTHDAEVKLFEFLARRIVALVTGNTSVNQQEENNIEEEADEMTRNTKESVVPIQLREQVKSYDRQIRKREQSLDSIITKIVEIASRFDIVASKDNIQSLQNAQEQLKQHRNALGHKENNILHINLPEKMQEIEEIKVELGETRKRLKEYTNGDRDLSTEWYNNNELIDRASKLNEQNQNGLEQVLNDWEVTGTIAINDEQDACRSCQGIITQFVNKFGGENNIVINVNAVVHHYYGKRGNR